MRITEGMVRHGAQAMRRSKAWPAVFAVGSAETLARACLEAVLTDPPARAARPPHLSDADPAFDASVEAVACAMREG